MTNGLTTGARGDTRGRVRVPVAVAIALLPPVVTVGLLTATGAFAAGVDAAFGDAGDLVRYGLPVTRALRDGAAAVTIGALVLVCTVVPPTTCERAGFIEGPRMRLVNIAAVTGSVWFWSGVGVLLFTYGDVAGIDPFGPAGLDAFPQFTASVEIGQALTVSLGLSAVVAFGSMLVRSINAAGWLAVLAALALWPLASTGHAAGSSNHDVGVNTQMAHLLAMSVWAGGLAALLLVRPGLTERALGDSVGRYSRLAGASALLLGMSGLAAAWVRLDDWSDLGSTYGRLLLAKALAFTVLLGAGAWHRQRLLPRLRSVEGTDGADGGSVSRAFARLAVAEVAVMSATIGVAVALSRTPPPASAEASSAAESLLGFPLPAPLTTATFVTEWRIDTFWTPLALLALAWYLAAMQRLRRRGDRWPLGRLVSWTLGVGLLVWATSGSPGVYGEVLFSMHMVQHMTIATAAPTFLVLGAPVTLALRAVPARRDGSRGAREWLLAVTHSRVAGFLANPIVAGGMFIGSLVVFYSSSLFEASLRSHTIHLLMVFHFLAAGYLLASGICGIDPGPKRFPYPARLLMLMIVFGMHALYSVSLMATTDVIAQDWYAALGRDWGATLQRDQYVGATLGWLLGDYPIAILGFALVWAWVRSDQRESARYDRAADRGNDTELQALNERLQRLHDSTER